MRKKTIKFYFFNKKVSNPATNSLFCFSKKSIKQYRQISKLRTTLKYIRSKKKRYELLSVARGYKAAMSRAIRANQWHLNNGALVSLFLNSFYNRRAVLKTIMRRQPQLRKQLILWFVVRKRYNRFKYSFIRRYPKMGVLSSHFVHILSKKNFTYQTRSKYRAKVYNMTRYYSYLHTYTKFLHMYIRTLYDQLYFFTSNPGRPSLWVDTDFYTHTSAWLQNTLYRNKTQKFMNTIVPSFASTLSPNPAEFTHADFIGVLAKWDILDQLATATKPEDKEKLVRELHDNPDNLKLDLIYMIYGTILYNEHIDFRVPQIISLNQLAAYLILR